MKTLKVLLLALLFMAIASPANAVTVPPEPCIDVELTFNPNVSKVGDEVMYEIRVTNCGGTPLELLDAYDSLMGDIIDNPFELPAGEEASVWFGYTIKADDPDPLVNEVTVVALGPMGEFEVTATAEVDLVHPSIKITKTVDNPNPCFGDTVIYAICIENTGDWPLENIVVTDSLLGTLYGYPHELSVGFPPATVYWPYEVPENAPCPLVNTARVDSDPEGPMENPINDEDSTEIYPEPCGGDEGCTPGFWKNNADKHGANAWCDLFSPDDRFSDWFLLDEDLEIRGNGKRTIVDPTLLEALDANGGGVNAMVRHGVAAMLNACSDCVNYPNNDELEIILMITDTLNGVPGADTVDELHSMFAEYNEAGCPVNQRGECVGVEDEIDG